MNSARIRLLERRLIALVLVTLATACGATQPAPTHPPGPTASVTAPLQLPVVVSLAGRFDEPDLLALHAKIAAFEQANPDVLVEVVNLSETDEAPFEALAAGLRPTPSRIDVALVPDAWLAQLTAENLAQPGGEYGGSDQALALAAHSLYPAEAARLMAFLADPTPPGE